MQKHLYIFILAIFFSFSSEAQKYTISGYVEDFTTGERLIGVAVYDANKTSIGTVTNVYGYFSMTIPAGTTKLTAAFVGYNPVQSEFNLTKDTLITIQIQPILLNEVVVKGGQNHVEDVQMSVVDVPIQTIMKLPVIFGEVDILKTLQLLPGVKSGSEGSSGFYVRGGGPDQNLILLDGVPVYNVNHLFGFFSVFNGYAISDITLIKGGFPARYGGRLSSVLDIRMKEGNMKKFAGEISIGLIASKFTFEGPIKKDKTSFIISGRRTYLDLLTIPFQLMYAGFDPNVQTFWGGYFFHDLNAKVNHKFSDKDRIFFSIYAGKDKAYMNTKFTYDGLTDVTRFNLNWGNITSSVRWNHIFTPKLFGNTTATFSNYDFVTEVKNEYQHYSWLDPNDTKIYTDKFEIEYLSGIMDYGINSDFDYNLNTSNKIKFGGNYIYHTFKPGVSAMRNSSVDETQNMDTTFGGSNLYANEFGCYFEDEISLGKKLKVNIGGHYSLFMVRDTFYESLEPRIAARFMITDDWSVKAAYTHMTQYLHFLTNSSIGLPTDLWLPATDLVPPEYSVQYNVGTAFTFFKDYNFSIEYYFKTMSNLIEYKEGATFFGDIEGGGMTSEGWEQKIEIGDGYSQGMEFLLEKKLGDFSGWIGYTLSWTNRKFENIAFGKEFPYRYDTRNDIGIAMTYKLNDHIDFGVTWIYRSGIAVTLAEQRYLPIEQIQNYILQNGSDPNNNWYYYETTEYYGTRNNYRLPSYHRLDVGVNFTKIKKRGTRTWSVGLYNAYNRLNAFYVDFNGGLFGEYTQDPSKRELIKYSLFPIIPSVSYNFKFD